MLKRVLKRSASLLLALVMLVSLLPSMTLYASAASGDIVEGLTANGDYTSITGGIQVIAESTSFVKGSCNDTDAAPKSASMTLTNALNTEALLAFDYEISIEKADGYVKLDGEALTASGHFEETVASKQQVNFDLFSGTPSASETKTYASTIKLTNISLAVDKDITTTFLIAENGSYTVDGKEVTEQLQHTKNAKDTTELKAIPAEDYKFFGWYSVSDDTYLSKTADWTTNLTKDQVIKAVFAPSNAPIFQAGVGNEFFDLNEAISFAQENAQKTIVLIGDGVLPAGDYVIPSGLTLLVPYSDAHTLCTTAPIWNANDSSASSAKAYKTLTMASGANIIVQDGGAISVSARAQNTTPNAGVVMGPWGLIKMESDSNITVKNGGNLYCYGFISGQGSVLAESGANVYEDFQVTSFRGGNASASMNGGNKDKVFPFTQFYIQNIEVPLTLEAGATETVSIGVTMTFVGLQKGSGTLIGDNSGLFRLTTGSVTKRYDGAADRLVIEINGDAQISGMTVNMGNAGNINSEKFVVPITNNMTVRVNSGHTLGIEYDMAMLPGSVLSVDQDANLNLKSNLYVYDRDEWIGKGFAANNTANFVKLPNAPGRSYNRTNDDIVDAKLDINGTMTVDGALYTTASGANITSSEGTGKLIYNAGAGTEPNTHQVTQSGNTVTSQSVAITAAQLKNAASEANEYSVTAGAVKDDVFYYHDDMWDKENAPEGEHYPHVVAVDEAVDATCYETGLTEGSHCSICGKILVAQTVVEKLDEHTWNEGTVTKNATCTEPGEKVFTCTVEGCGAAKTEETPFAEHTWNNGEVTKAPTCAKTGVKTYTCTICSATKTEEMATVAHTPENDARVEPTCVDSGKTAGSHCSVCGKVIIAQETIPANGHAWGAWSETKAPNCMEKGEEMHTCEVCGETETREINALEHDYTVLTHDVSGHWMKCSRCDATEEKQEHIWNDGKVTKAPTCEETGVRTYTCSVCGETKTETIPVLGHDKIAHEAQEATCTEIGWNAYDTCSRCDYSTYEEISSLGHDKIAHEAQAVTCTEIGWNAYDTCSRCDYSTYEEISALGHKMVFGGWGEWTETEDGWTISAELKCDHTDCNHKEPAVVTVENDGADSTCSQAATRTYTAKVVVDDEPYTENKSITIAKKAHTAGEVQVENEKAATCEEGGSYDEVTYCTVCGEELTRETKTTVVLGHKWDDGVVKKPATCVSGNEITYTCERCGETRTENDGKVDPGHHETLTHIAEVDATCTTDGHYEYWCCEACGAIFSDENGVNPTTLEQLIITADHKWGAWTEETAPECETAGEEIRTCERCGETARQPIAPLNHKLTYVPEKAAACEEEGNVAHYLCEHCGRFFRDAEATEELLSVTIDALEHQWSAWAEDTAPGCETEGEEIRTCERCGEIETRSIDALGHSYGNPIWSWTGTEENEDWITATAEFVCVRCGDSQTAEANVKHETHHATCTGEGAEVYTATVKFGKTEDGEDRIYTDVMDVTISALGHVYDKVQESVDWTWTEDANGDWVVIATLHCTECGEELVLTGEDVTITDAVTTEPTCEETGVRTYTAKVIVGVAEYTSQEVKTIDALGHDIVEHTRKEPTCEEAGWTAYETCSRCDYSTEGEEIPALSHDWDEGVVTVEASCTAEGVQTYTCGICGKSRTEAIEMIAHRMILVEGKAPTCTEDGNLPYWSCVTCGGLFSDEAGEQSTTLTEKRIPARGHRYDVETVRFTWTQNEQGGWAATATISCDCGEVLPAVNARITIEEQAATCTEDGLRTYIATAELDGNEYTDTKPVTLEKLGHNYGAPVWTWNEDNSAATATFTCANAAHETVTVNAAVVPTTQGYTTTYTASVEFNSVSYKDTRTVTITPPPGGNGGGSTGGSTTIVDTDVPLTSVLPFDDVAEADWFYDAVKYVYENELMSGTSDNIFDPYIYTTRSMIVTILYRVAEGNVTAEEAFDDVNTFSWYSEAVTWGTKNDVVAGYGNGLFGPHDDITREQLVSILWRYIGRPTAKSGALPFSDADQVSDYAREAMQWALEVGIIHGKSETILDPKGHATRAETAAILNRYLELTK